MSHLMSCVGMKPIYSMHVAVWMRRVDKQPYGNRLAFQRLQQFIAWTVTLNPLVNEQLPKLFLRRGREASEEIFDKDTI